MVSELAICAVLFLGADAPSQPAKGQPAAQPQAAQPQAAQPQAAQPQAAQPQAAQPAKPQPAKPQPAKPQPAKPQAAAQPQAAQQPATPKIQLISVEKDIIDRTNAERAQYGLPPFEVDPQLQESARAHAAWMTNNHAFQHTRQPVAENIAMGQQSGEEVVRCWMNSSGHRANILNGGNRRIGAAAYRTIHGTIFWCQQFTQ